MQRILIKCNYRADAVEMLNYLEAELPYEISMAQSQLELEGALNEKPTHLLILQTGSAMTKDIQYVQTLRQQGFAHPILLLTGSLGNLAFDVFSEKYKAFFLERPFEMRALKGLARKLMVMKTVTQQIHRRYRTQQAATIESFATADQIESRMYNLSVGGAYFEFTKKPDLRIGDLTRVKIPLANMNREHIVTGRVIWTTLRGHSGGGFGVGVRFMKTHDAARQISEKV